MQSRSRHRPIRPLVSPRNRGSSPFADERPHFIELALGDLDIGQEAALAFRHIRRPFQAGEARSFCLHFGFVLLQQCPPLSQRSGDGLEGCLRQVGATEGRVFSWVTPVWRQLRGDQNTFGWMNKPASRGQASSC